VTSRHAVTAKDAAMTEKTLQRRRNFAPRRTADAVPRQQSMRLSLVLIGLAAGLAVGVTSWLGFLNDRTNSKLEIKSVEIAETGEVELTGARYRGLSPSGRPYEITAEQANEAQDGSGLVDMTQPTATVTMRNGSVVNIRSNDGVFNKNQDLVKMRGDVVVVQPDRNLRLDTETLQANLKAGEMHTNSAVIVRDTTRKITADNMRAFDNGARIIFGGTARMTINNSDNLSAPDIEIKS
jgi:LPS export ABC transporter protein LptC